MRALSFLALNDSALDLIHRHRLSLRDLNGKGDPELTTSALLLLLNSSRKLQYARMYIDGALVDELVKLGRC